jgi:hypothetical protein
MKKIYFLIILTTLASCSKKQESDPVAKPFGKIVILGNSITYAPGSPGSEWVGPWGMAASAPEFDYVHLLTKDFTARNSSSTVKILNIAAFERGFQDYNLDSNLRELKDTKPDLLILRIGENVTLNNANSASFKNQYKALISYFTSNNPSLKVLGVGSIWGNEAADNIMAAESDFITLRTLNSDPTNYAYGKWQDIGIQQHPSDKGMLGIEQLIWAKVKTL